MSRTVLVTGSTRGLGLATARRFARAGDHVVLSGRSEAALGRAVDLLRREGLEGSGVGLDVDSEVSVRCAAQELSRRHDRLDVLVNNAGILPEATSTGAAFAEPSVLARTLHTNVVGAAAVIEAFLPLVLRSADGRVVNVSSTMGSLTDHADPSSPYAATAVPAYRASKAALNSLTVSLARRLEGTSVVVTAVCPGFVQTDLTPMSRDLAPLTADEAAEVVWRAGSATERPAGRFVDAAGVVPW
ncbi:SDR family NAD(P)-dependent oxidoreductase [Nocardioides lijunqiniae]|uniref:SDR family NAD(P)-dependent oxidoreductase n=1 Tax=Nocardioides lijunqiniae TaxID=2760832 RepID=UPI001877C8F8|nr:SDR family NAD(P)-dependent oxidoreductase [Nocardioides lijunqiniae]